MVLGLLLAAAPVSGQSKAGRAAALSILLPGLGHSYVNNGSWRGTAGYLVLAEAGMWLGLATSHWQRRQSIQSYRTYAATHAGAQLQGKDRRFLVALGSYMSSDEYQAFHLRQRRWDQVGYVSDPAFRWHWRSETDMMTYQALRRSADTWTRRRIVFLATLVTNRALAALSAARSARRQGSALAEVSLSLMARSGLPVVQVAVQL